MNKKLLEDIGLTKGEVTVYMALLKLGETTTGRIIDKAQISSGKIYEILEKLMRKGLASYIMKDKTKYFRAASPNRLLDYMHEKEKDLQRKEDELARELPALLALGKEGSDSRETTLFKSYRGIQTAIFEALHCLSNGEEVLAMGIISHKKEQYNILWQKWHKERIQKKIGCKMLFSDKDTDYFRFFKGLRFTETRILEGITPSAIDIMGTRVLIFTYGEESSCLSINNPEIAQSFKTFFNTLWSISRKTE